MENTSTILNILYHHVEEHQEFNNQKDNQTNTDVIQRLSKHPADDMKANAVTDRQFINFIILGDQPLSVIENVGFCSRLEHLEPMWRLPSREYRI